jgi:hypothetical protein
MSTVTGYITNDTSITAYVYDLSVYGVTAQFSMNGIPMSKAYEYIDEYVVIVTPVTESSTFTLGSTHIGKCIRCNSATDVSCYIPTDASYNFTIGTILSIQQIGEGEIIAGPYDSSTTALYGDSKTMGQYKFLQLWKSDSNEWNAVGGTT